MIDGIRLGGRRVLSRNKRIRVHVIIVIKKTNGWDRDMEWCEFTSFVGDIVAGNNAELQMQAAGQKRGYCEWKEH